MKFTISTAARMSPWFLTLLLFAGTAIGQVILDVPAMEEVQLPSFLEDAFLEDAFPVEDGDSKQASCKQACRAVESGQVELTADGATFVEPRSLQILGLQILKLRSELGDEFSLASESPTLLDPQVEAAEFLTALDRLSEGSLAIQCPEVLGPEVMSENQAAALRYAADRVEQVGAPLERSNLAEQAAMARSLAEAVLASPAQQGRVARPATSPILR